MRLYDNRMEQMCALLCLHSTLNRVPETPPVMTRRAVRKLMNDGVLDGLILRDTGSVPVDRLEQARMLLSRASSVFCSLEAYCETGFDFLMPDDPAWPEKLNKLGANMPLYLFAIGNLKLLQMKTIAVAGSRIIRKETRGIAERIGRALAGQGLTVVSGDAYGIDRAVQTAALENGGNVIIDPAKPVKECLCDPVLRRALEEGRLLILCETPPQEQFSAQKALTRNHTIYALGSCALVVASREGRGGSWSGANACISGRWSPVYVLDEEGEDFRGNEALLKQGAHRMMLIRGEAQDEILFEGLSSLEIGQYRTKSN